MKKPVTSYETLKAASAGMKVPVAMLRAARDAGCPGFDHGQVNVAKYQAWAAENDPQSGGEEGKEAWQIQLLKKQCRRLDLDYQKQLGQLIPRGTLKDTIQSVFAPITQTLEKHLDKAAFNAICRDVKDALAKLAGDDGDGEADRAGDFPAEMEGAQ